MCLAIYRVLSSKAWTAFYRTLSFFSLNITQGQPCAIGLNQRDFLHPRNGTLCIIDSRDADGIGGLAEPRDLWLMKKVPIISARDKVCVWESRCELKMHPTGFGSSLCPTNASFDDSGSRGPRSVRVILGGVYVHTGVLTISCTCVLAFVE